MTEPDAPAARRFAKELQRLYADAGSPEYWKVVRHASSRLPPVDLSDSTLSDWLTGKSVPSNQASVRFLVTYLQDLVARRTGQRPPSIDNWLRLHREAKQDRRAKRGGRPAKRPATPAASSILPELAGLLRLMNLYAEEHPYAQPGQHLHALSAVYVSQSVASPVEAVRQVWDPELDEVAMVEEDRRVTRLAQPFEEVFGAHDHFVIEGAAGLGKSTLGRILVGDLVGALLDGKPSRLPGAGLVPVILPARMLAKHVGRPWGEALREAVNAEYGQLGDGVVAAETFLRPVAGRDWLVVIDALDEIPDQSDRDRLLKALSTRMAMPGPARFLVTSRPLIPGEIAQLQGPRVGFFELQPFDAAAMEAFAHRHFNPTDTAEGAALAADFLSQVRLAGLDQVITVPLLATVAAQVFTARRRDQPLPSSRYELYEAYIAYFTTRNASAAEVFGAGTDAEWCDWLDRQRAVLLEALAVEYTSSEKPLAEVALGYMRAHAPMPPDLPLGWEISLGDWLSRTGVLGRHGVRLRFRHQTFAEHLAATARARELPAPFDPAEPAWHRLVSQFLLDEEAAEQTLAHFLHLHGAGSGLIGYLQERSQAEREKAGALIMLGVPCTDTELGAFLNMAEGQIYGDVYLDLRPASGLAAHAMVQERMYAWLRDERTPARIKIAIVDVLRERSPKVRHEGAILLEGLSADAGRPGEIRAGAAEVLAKLGEPYTAKAVVALHRIAANRDVADGSRNAAAAALATIGGEHRSTAADLLHRIAEDPGVGGWNRREAAENLARLGPGARLRAADLLFRLATDTAVEPTTRRDAAESLAALGGDHRRRAIDALRPNPSVSYFADDPRMWSAAAALLEPGGRVAAAQLLRQVCDDESVDGNIRLNAARELAGFGGRLRADAARVMRDLAVSVRMWSTRYSAAIALANLGSTYQDLSIVALTGVAGDPGSTAYARAFAARLLARHDGAARQTATLTLLELTNGTTSDLSSRAEAALELANLDEPSRKAVARQFHGRLADPRLTPSDRILAAVVLTSLEPESAVLESDILHHLATVADGHHEARMLAANTLIELTGPNLDRAVQLLIAASTDPSSGDEQGAAAKRLMEVEDSFREHAASTLRALARTSDNASHYAEVVSDLADFGDAYLTEASSLLAQCLSDPWIDDDTIPYVVFRLRSLSPGAAMVAANVVADILDDPLRDVPKFYSDDLAILDRCLPGVAGKAYDHARRFGDLNVVARCTAAEELVRTDETYRDRVVDGLRRDARDMPGAGADRTLPLALADSLAGGDRQVFAGALADIINAPDAVLPLAATAVRNLDREGPSYRVQVVDACRRWCTDDRLEGVWRLWAIERLAAYQPEAVMNLALELTTDPAAYFSLRLRAVQFLGDTSKVGSFLEGCAHAPVVNRDERIAVAKAMLERGTEDTDLVAAILTGVMADPAASAEDRLSAARTLAGLDGARAFSAAALAERLLTEEHSGVVDRSVGAAFLAWLRPDTRPLARELLAGLLGNDRSPSRLAVTKMLASIRGGSPAVERALAEIVGNAAESDNCRMEALTMLAGTVGGREQSGVLVRDLAGDPTVDAYVRIQAVRLMARIRPGERGLAGAELIRIADAVEAGVDRVEALHLAAIVDRGRRGTCAAILLRLAGDPMQDAMARQKAAMLLTRFGDESAELAIESLAVCAAEPSAPPDARLKAAQGLLGIEGHRGRGRKLLRDLASDLDQDDYDRVVALAELVRIDAGERANATAVMSMVANGSDSPAGARFLAAEALFGISGARTESSAALRRLATDSMVSVFWRRRAAALLHRHGAKRRAEACELLRRIAVDQAVPASERIDAIRDLARFDSVRTDLEPLLRALIEEDGIATGDRNRAAETLAGFGESARGDAIRLLAGQAEQADAPSQFAMLGQLSEMGPSARRIVSNQLRGVATAGRLDKAVALVQLVDIDREHDSRAVQLLKDVAADSGIDANARLWATAWLVRLGPPHVKAAADLLGDLTTDPDARIWERLAAARMMARLGAEHRSRAIGALAVLMRAGGGDPWELADCAVAYEALDPKNRADALEVLGRLAGDPTGYVARQLLMYGPEAQITAVAALERTATDRDVGVGDRAQAAAVLVRMGRAQALDVFGEVLTTDGAPELELALALATFAEVRPPEREAAASALASVAQGRASSMESRRRAASALTALSNRARRVALEVLRELAVDPMSDAQAALAVAELARWDASQRPLAAAAVKHFVSDPLDPAVLVALAENVSRLAPDPSRSASLLHRYARDPAWTSEVRHRAYLSWVALSPNWNRVGPARLQR